MAQREIKFRAWDTVCERMYFPDDVSGPLFYLSGSLSLDRSWVTGDFRLLQFTGLADKNGTEIYEGDILEKREMDYHSDECRRWEEGGYDGPEPEKTLIKRDVCTLEHFRYWLKNESFGYEGEDMESPYEWTVIGNIYENPELLQP